MCNALDKTNYASVSSECYSKFIFGASHIEHKCEDNIKLAYDFGSNTRVKCLIHV